MNVQEVKKIKEGLYTIEWIEEGLYTIESFACPDCSTKVKVQITGPQMWTYNQGGHVQDVIPDEPKEIRERFISGTCGPCWEKMFPKDKE